MSGFGERFRRFGYSLPKPLIEIDGKPMISHVIDMFPGEFNFLFICNEGPLNSPNYQMREVLRLYCPTGRIVRIPPHKLGPVHAVREISSLIDPRSPVLVNYCDFSCYWNWEHIKNFVVTPECDGSIPAYKGFHPHSLGTTNYAYIRERDGWVLDIQEKKPFTDNRMKEYASSGSYYYASGQIMSDVFSGMLDRGASVNGEYYVSLAYRELLEGGGRGVTVYPLQHFMQWGTPEDVAECRTWSEAFERLASHSFKKQAPRGSVVVPMAGLGQRFHNEGYTDSKPLIQVSERPMVVQAVADLPRAQQYAFVMRQDKGGHEVVAQELRDTYHGAVIEVLSNVTDGQACTALAGLDALERELGSVAEPVRIGACDNGALYYDGALKMLIEAPEVDVIVWGVRGHANAVRHPKMFGWIEADDQGRIERISVKTPVLSPSTTPIVIGTFTFKRAEDFRMVVRRLIQRNGRVNGEFYIDSCISEAIEMGLCCHLFEVDSFLSWGTPNDLRTFEYWQSCFHKWESHSY